MYPRTSVHREAARAIRLEKLHMDGPLPLPAAKMEVAGSRFDPLVIRSPVELSARHVNTAVIVEEAIRVERQRDNRKLVSTVDAGINKVGMRDRDRKSTRLNSSHVASSYAVFCL